MRPRPYVRSILHVYKIDNVTIATFKQRYLIVGKDVNEFGPIEA